MPIVPVVLLGALTYQIVNLLRYLSGHAYGSAITLVIAWAAGVAAVVVTAQTQFAGDIHIGTLALDKLSTWSQVWIGLQAASLFSAVHDTKTAIDSSQSAVVPPLIRNDVPVAPQPVAPAPAPTAPAA